MSHCAHLVAVTVTHHFRRLLSQFRTDYHQILQALFVCPHSGHLHLSSCLLPADCLDITYMCYEFRIPLFPGQLMQARLSDLSVTSTQQSVNW